MKIHSHHPGNSPRSPASHSMTGVALVLGVVLLAAGSAWLIGRLPHVPGWAVWPILAVILLVLFSRTRSRGQQRLQPKR